MSEQDELTKIFPNNLRNLIAKKDVTQKELAEYMQVSSTTISGWLAGQKLPRMGKIDKLCKFFGVDRESLLTRQSNPSQKLPLSTEEKQLINKYRSLNIQNQRVVSSIITAFLTQQMATNFGNIVQNNNGNGIFIAPNGGSNALI